MVSKHLAHWVELLSRHLRAAAASPRVAVAAALCGAAVVVRAATVGSDTKRDIINSGQKLVQQYLNALTVCNSRADRLAFITAIDEITLTTLLLVITAL